MGEAKSLYKSMHMSEMGCEQRTSGGFLEPSPGESNSSVFKVAQN